MHVILNSIVFFHFYNNRGYGSGGQNSRKAFRKWYACIDEIRSILESGTPMMALTATAVKRTKEIIIKSLAMRNPVTITVSPNKVNVKYSVWMMDKNIPVALYFKWLTDELKAKGISTPRVIIYCQTIKQCHVLYSILLEEIGQWAYPDKTDCRKRLVEMLHSTTPDRVKENIDSLSNVDGIVRCLICTIAFGMGMDCKGVRTIINFGPSKNIESYMQESGRCGRDGEGGRSCDCNLEGCAVIEDIFPTKLPVPTAVVKRTVTAKQHDQLKEKLILLQKQLMLPILENFSGHSGNIISPHTKAFLGTFSSFQINQILKNIDHLFTLDDIMQYVEIWRKEHAYKVLLLIREIFDDIDDVPEMSFNNSDAVDLEEENEWEEVLNETGDWMNVMDYSDAGMSSFDISYIENVGQELPETD